jgi:hypothetical protein
VLLPPCSRPLPLGSYRLSVESLLQLFLQELALQHELGALIGVAGEDGLDAVPQALLPVEEPVALRL